MIDRTRLSGSGFSAAAGLKSGLSKWNKKLNEMQLYFSDRINRMDRI
jgi:hypothetical protein